jgi:hypothetical protein
VPNWKIIENQIDSLFLVSPGLGKGRAAASLTRQILPV